MRNSDVWTEKSEIEIVKHGQTVIYFRGKKPKQNRKKLALPMAWMGQERVKLVLFFGFNC